MKTQHTDETRNTQITDERCQPIAVTETNIMSGKILDLAARIAELEKRDSELWVEFQATDKRIKPYVDELNELRHRWCANSDELRKLRGVLEELNRLTL